MARLFLLFIFSVASWLCLAQEVDTDSVSQDSTLAKVRLIQPSLLIDYGKLIMQVSSRESKFEGGIELLFVEKYAFIAEMGYAELTPPQAYANGSYQSSGTYFRVGGGYYRQRTPKNGLGIYALYGSSRFDEEGTFNYDSPSESQPSFSTDLSRSDLSANWWELVLYTDQKLNSFLKLGLSLRYRRMISYDEFTPIDVYSIPGYGRAFDKSTPVANLILKVSF